MKILLLMAQRKESYPGEYAPEALNCMSESDHSDNPDYLNAKKNQAEASGEFERIEIITLQVDTKSIMKILRPAGMVIDAEVAG